MKIRMCMVRFSGCTAKYELHKKGCTPASQKQSNREDGASMLKGLALTIIRCHMRERKTHALSLEPSLWWCTVHFACVRWATLGHVALLEIHTS